MISGYTIIDSERTELQGVQQICKEFVIRTRVQRGSPRLSRFQRYIPLAYHRVRPARLYSRTRFSLALEGWSDSLTGQQPESALLGGCSALRENAHLRHRGLTPCHTERTWWLTSRTGGNDYLLGPTPSPFQILHVDAIMGLVLSGGSPRYLPRLAQAEQVQALQRIDLAVGLASEVGFQGT